MHNANELYKVAFFDTHNDTIAKNQELSFTGLVEELSVFKMVPKETAKCMVAGHFHNEGRKTENLTGKQLIILDVDKYNSDISHLEGVLKRDLGDYQWIAHSTASYSCTAPRIRIILFLKNEIPTMSYKNIATNFINTLSTELRDAIDETSSITANKLMYIRTRPNTKEEPWYKLNLGKLIDPSIYDKPSSILCKKANDNEVDPLLLAANNNPKGFSEQEIWNTLSKFPPEFVDYSDWIKVGMTLHHEFQGADKGLEIWDEWSKLDTKRYKGLHELKGKWDGFKKTSNPVTFASIVDMVNKTKKNNAKSNTYMRPLIEWKDRKKGGKPRYTEANFQLLIDAYGYEIYYDVIKKEKCIYKNGEKYIDNDTATSDIINDAITEDIYHSHIKSTIEAFAQKNKRNLWKEWVESEPWDGVDRFLALCDTLKVENKDHSIKNRNRWLQVWLLQMIHVSCLNNDEERKSSRNMLILQGIQNIGKTKWIRSLAPAHMRKDYILTAQSLDFSSNRDLTKIGNYVIVECGELKRTLSKFGKSSMDDLKNYIGGDADVLDKKYKQDLAKHIRTTVLIGTVNEQKFLYDETGNSRFLVIPVIKCDHNHNIDMQQLYAQLLVYAKEHPNAHMLTDEEYKLQEDANKNFIEQDHLYDILVDLIIKKFDMSSEKKDRYYITTDLLDTIGFSMYGHKPNDVYITLEKVMTEEFNRPKSKSRNKGFKGYPMPCQRNLIIQQFDEDFQFDEVVDIAR